MPDMKGMGTTVTVALVRGQRVLIAHVGDSRAYHVSGRKRDIHQITSDHSFVEALLAAGHITPEQADEHPMRNVLYRALGQTEDVDVDVYDSMLQIGDRLVLCSDGLTRHVKPPEIAELTLADDNPHLSSQKLIDLANDRGGEDNVSVIVVAVEQSTTKNQVDADVNFAAEEDDEDTLVLKDHLLRSVTERKPPPDPETEDTLPSPPISKYNLSGKSANDTAGAYRVLVPPDPIATKVSRLADSSEGDGEGHDTRAPEQ
jgi:serine/threonine protein phosphatase PrpC